MALNQPFVKDVLSRDPPHTLTRMSTYVAVRNLLYSLKHTCILLLPLHKPEEIKDSLQVHKNNTTHTVYVRK